MSHSLYKCLFCPVSPVSHEPRCFQGGNTHTEHQGKQNLRKFQTLHSALLLLTDVTLQFYLSSLKAFCLSEPLLGFPVGPLLTAWEFRSSSVQPWQPWLGFMGTVSFPYSAMRCSPSFPATYWQAALWVWSCLYIQLSSASPSCLFGSTLPIPLGFFTHVRSRIKTEGSEWSKGRSRVEQEVKWDGEEEKAEITTE